MSIDWHNILSSLSYDNVSNNNNNNKRNKCHIRLLDTVFIDNESKQPHWYYTTKSGTLNIIIIIFFFNILIDYC